MILLWDGKQIQAVDLDKVIPGPRAEEVAGLLGPGYLRGYLEGRGHDVAIREIKKRGRLGRDYRQIQKLLRKQPSSPPLGAPWQYAMFLKERILEQAGPLQPTAPLVDGAQPLEVQPTMPMEEQIESTASAVDDEQTPEEQPTMPVEEQTETAASAGDEVQENGAEQTTATPADGEQPDVVLPNEVQPSVVQPNEVQPNEVQPTEEQTTEEPAAQNDGGGGKKRRKRRRKKRRRNCATTNDTCQ